ncbi:hypothetical protein P43SY_010072 [Pythium insidiosum]|uniref:Transmembrane protein n=1 Tax=Pythium insidiosum TaxID=114742 RepID=A0AAD5LJW6_PYTIN|nr:hypothetical protein P43SY_010072 [Pythium insidiosum]
MMRCRHKISLRRLVLLLLNVASTVLTLLTGLRENPVVVFVTGRYDGIRARLREGTINYDIVRDDAFKQDHLTSLPDVGASFRFFSAPRRSPSNLAEDRSTCLRVNSMNASILTLNYDDFWGRGARRAQIFLYSISAPHCSVLNFRDEWVADCISDHAGDAAQCHQFIAANFETLGRDRTIQVGVERDFGEPGTPFLKCRGRPMKPFAFETDLMVHQSYWAGGSYHVEVQTSACRATPLLRDDLWQWGLFQVEAADQDAVVMVALPPSGWFATIVTFGYGVVTLVMIARGVMAAFLQSRAVLYLPKALRFLGRQWPLRYLLPFMAVATTGTDNENTVITFKGSLLVASDLWMNHWLYILLSILESIVNIRMTYIVLEMGTWMLGKKVDATNFIFMCAALTRITWIMCLLHTVLRLGARFLLRFLRTMHVLRPALRHRLEWYVDASALFLSFKIYNLLLCLVLFLFLQLHGTTTFMGKQPEYKQGVFGGAPRLEPFWGNEIICDLFVLLSILTACGLVIGVGALQTQYRCLANNGVIRLLQQRYVFVGWDVLTAAQMLGINPYDPTLIEDGVVMTSCSLGSLLQTLYESGPSGLVHLAGDYLFMDGGFSKGALKFHYPVKRAMDMGLCSSNRSTAHRKDHDHTDMSTSHHPVSHHVHPVVDHDMAKPLTKKSIFDRHLRIFAEGYAGKVLLVDAQEPGALVRNPDTGQREYVVEDALTQITLLDIKPLLRDDKKLHIL